MESAWLLLLTNLFKSIIYSSLKKITNDYVDLKKENKMNFKVWLKYYFVEIIQWHDSFYDHQMILDLVIEAQIIKIICILYFNTQYGEITHSKLFYSRIFLFACFNNPSYAITYFYF